MRLERYADRRVSDYFGENTLGFSQLREKLPPDTCRRLVAGILHFTPLGPDVADAVAAVMRDWALSRGATAYTHWFQPLTGLTAEKHDSFLAHGPGGRPVEEFTGEKLIKSEPDASSFPHGGIRSTFEARGYAAWDPSSPAFLMECTHGRTLFIPSVFVSHDGHVLDKKTPLIKSIQAVSEAARRLLGLLGEPPPDWVYPQVGAEQEYFLVDLEYFRRRPDLRLLGYTLFGQRTPRGQQFEDHYFGAIRERVLAFMQEFDIELYRLGIPAKTRHNEVAPNQFEIAALHETANLAADHNQLLMEVLRRVARRHGLAALLHEKPFAAVNGSGKHNNWSLMDNRKVNMFEPGQSRRDNLRFLLFVTAVLYGVHRHGDLLRAIIASPGNDFRLGSHEAPPGILSVYLGEELSGVFHRLLNGSFENAGRRTAGDFQTGIPFIPPFAQDSADRNRTSPFAFTGNKFEFRAVGASASIAMPNTALNTIMAEALNHLSARLESHLADSPTPEEAALAVLREVYPAIRPVHFDGDNYSPAWREEAARRGLPDAPHTVAALAALQQEKALALFETHGVLRREEVLARFRVKSSIFTHTVALELRTARIMIRTLFLPACFAHERNMLDLVARLVQTWGAEDPTTIAHRDMARRFSDRVRHLLDQLARLDTRNEEFQALPPEHQALFCAEVIRPELAATREVVDKLEERVDAALWPVPRFWEMLAPI